MKGSLEKTKLREGNAVEEEVIKKQKLPIHRKNTLADSAF